MDQKELSEFRRELANKRVRNRAGQFVCKKDENNSKVINYGWTTEDRESTSQASKNWPRDQKGRWIKEK